MKLTKLQLIKLWNAIDACKEFKNTKFIYAALRTKKNLEEEIELLNALNKPSRKYLDYSNERIKLCQKYATKTDGGSCAIAFGEYCFTPDNKVAFDNEHAAVKEKYLDFITERQEQVEAYGNVLKEEVDVPVFQVELRNVPQELDANILEGLLPLIKDE